MSTADPRTPRATARRTLARGLALSLPLAALGTGAAHFQHTPTSNPVIEPLLRGLQTACDAAAAPLLIAAILTLLITSVRYRIKLHAPGSGPRPLRLVLRGGGVASPQHRRSHKFKRRSPLALRQRED